MQVNFTNTNTQNTDSTTQNTNTDSTQNSHFSSYLGNAEEENETETEKEIVSQSTHQKTQTTEELIADLLSVIRTGLTVSEMEYLQELLAKINKLIKEKTENGMSPDERKEISNLISELEDAVAQLQKRITGEFIIEADDENLDNRNESTSIEIGNLENRMASLEVAISELYKEKLDQTSIDDVMMDNINISAVLTTEDIQKGRQKYSELFTDERFEEILTRLNLNDLSDEEKTLYKSIIDDRYISNEEIEDLSYEQMETLGKFIFIKDGKDSYVDESLINTDYKAGTLLSIPLIGDDENFKNSLFQMVQNMDTQKQINNFMAPLTGNSTFHQIIAFPQLLNINYDGKDIENMLEKMIEDYKIKLDSVYKADEVEFYQNAIAQYTDLFNLYQEFSGNEDAKLEKEKYISDIKQYLLNDLISFLQTGLTVSEVEKLEKALAKIDMLIEKSEEKDISEEEIKEMIEKLKEQLNEIYQRLGGKGEIEVEEDLETQNSEGLTETMKEYKSIVSSLRQALEEIKSNASKKEQVSTDEELKLREQLKTYQN